MSTTVTLALLLTNIEEVEGKIHPEDLEKALRRHKCGAHGEESDEIKKNNRTALLKGQPLRSLYTDRNSVKFWIITQSDYRTTTIDLV